MKHLISSKHLLLYSSTWNLNGLILFFYQVSRHYLTLIIGSSIEWVFFFVLLKLIFQIWLHIVKNFNIEFCPSFLIQLFKRILFSFQFKSSYENTEFNFFPLPNKSVSSWWDCSTQVWYMYMYVCCYFLPYNYL